MKREILGDLLAIASGVVLLTIGAIYQTINPQGYYGAEPNIIILMLEVVMALFIFGLGIERLTKDKGCGIKEFLCDAILIACGLVLMGMFTTIAIKGQFVMYQVETWFIIMRCIVALIVIGLGIERFIDDCR